MLQFFVRLLPTLPVQELPVYNVHDIQRKEKKSIPFHGIVRQHSTGNAPDRNVMVIIQSYELECKLGTEKTFSWGAGKLRTVTAVMASWLLREAGNA